MSFLWCQSLSGVSIFLSTLSGVSLSGASVFLVPEHLPENFLCQYFRGIRGLLMLQNSCCQYYESLLYILLLQPNITPFAGIYSTLQRRPRSLRANE